MKFYAHFILKVLAGLAAGGSCMPVQAMAQIVPVRPTAVPRYIVETPPPRAPSSSLQRAFDEMRTPGAAASVAGSNSPRSFVGATLEELKKQQAEGTLPAPAVAQPEYRPGYILPSDVKALCQLKATVLHSAVGERLLLAIQIQSVKRGVDRADAQHFASDVVERLLKRCASIETRDDRAVFYLTRDQIQQAVQIYRDVIQQDRKQTSISDVCGTKDEPKDESETSDQLLSIAARDFDPEFVLSKLTPMQRMIATLLIRGSTKEDIIAQLWPGDVDKGAASYRQHVFQAIRRANEIICSL